MDAGKSPVPFTYEDYKSLPESLEQHELIDGELYVSPAPTTTHQIVAENILFVLLVHVRATGCGRVLHSPVDVVLGEGAQRDVVQPDIVFIDRARTDIITEAEIAGAPDLVIEILSPGTAERDRGLKKTIYARAGVPEYWIVDPAAEWIDVFTLGIEGYRTPARYEGRDGPVSSVVPDFGLPLEEAFRR